MSITALTVVRPVVVTADMLLESSVPEDDYPEWSADGVYALDARVLVTEQHAVYQSAVDNNTGNPPATAGTKWLRVGSSNRWKPFDKAINSQAAQAGSISYRLKPGRAVTFVGGLNITGARQMRVRMVDPVYGVVCDRSVSLARRPVAVGWWAWFFGERRAPAQALFGGLPSFPAAELLIDIEGGPDLAVGVLLIGQARKFSLGVRMGARVGLQDFSYKERSKFGDLELVEGAYADRASFSMLLRAREVDGFKAFLKDVRATPCLWIGSDRYESTTVYGPYKSFDILISYFDYSDAELELEGLT